MSSVSSLITEKVVTTTDNACICIPISVVVVRVDMYAYSKEFVQTRRSINTYVKLMEKVPVFKLFKYGPGAHWSP